MLRDSCVTAAEWAALIGAVEQAYSIESGQLGWALGVRLARFFLACGYYDDWRHVCELMLAGARRAVDCGREAMALHDLSGLGGLGELRRLQHRLDKALEGFEQTLAACGAAGQHSGQTSTTGRNNSGRFEGALPCLENVLPRLENALAYLHELADRHGDASAMRRLGSVHRPQRCYEKAARCLQQVLDALDVFSAPLRGVALVSAGPGSAVRLAALQGTTNAGW
jgi:hypothetical protein